MRFADYAVAYDISSDKERTRVHKVLKGFGLSVQKSVFECRLSRGMRDELLKKLKKLEIKTGFIKVYRLEYSSKKNVIGAHDGNEIDDGNAFIV